MGPITDHAVAFVLFFFSNKASIVPLRLYGDKHVGVFPGKMCSDRQKIMVVDRKNQTGQVLLFLAPDCWQMLQTQTMCRPSSQQNEGKIF